MKDLLMDIEYEEELALKAQQQMEEDRQRFNHYLETGEVVKNNQSLTGEEKLE